MPADTALPAVAIPSAQLEHERLTSLVNSMADGVLAVDKRANIVLYNGAALNILDRNDPIEHKPLAAVLSIVDKDNHPVDIVALVRNAKMPTTNRDYRLNYRDGSSINLYLSIAPVRLGYGERGQQGSVILLRDITREKSLEEERDEFISVASHELRTPIAIAEGNISNAQFMVNKGTDLDKTKRALDEAHSQVLFLADLVNDLSTLSRAERGKLAVEIEAIDVAELITELAHNYGPQATEKGLELKTDVHVRKPLSSSKLYVREILQNFITNSLKYTEHGSITLSATSAPDGVSFVVRDSGIGISYSDQKRVFQKFFRSEDFRTRKTKGTGLGLYVTAKLARLLHADISLKSQLNEGSAFTIHVPNLTKEDETKPPSQP